MTYSNRTYNEGEWNWIYGLRKEIVFWDIKRLKDELSDQHYCSADLFFYFNYCTSFSCVDSYIVKMDNVFRILHKELVLRCDGGFQWFKLQLVEHVELQEIWICPKNV
jgi:hypothetical protein